MNACSRQAGLHFLAHACCATLCRCECPWGHTGPDCSELALSACRISNSTTPGLMPCGVLYPKSCECIRWEEARQQEQRAGVWHECMAHGRTAHMPVLAPSWLASLHLLLCD